MRDPTTVLLGVHRELERNGVVATRTRIAGNGGAEALEVEITNRERDARQRLSKIRRNEFVTSNHRKTHDGLALAQRKVFGYVPDLLDPLTLQGFLPLRM